MSRITMLWGTGTVVLGVLWGGYALFSSGSDGTQRETKVVPQHIGGEAIPSPRLSRHVLQKTAPGVLDTRSPADNPASVSEPAATMQREAPAEVPAPDKPGRTRQRTATASAPTVSAAALLRSAVTVQHGRVHLRAQNLALHTVLRDVAAQSGITITDRAQTHTSTLTLDLDNVALEEALQQMLTAFDVFFLYRGTSGAASALQAVWIYPQGQGGHIFPGDDEDSAFVEALSQTDPEIRARGYETILARPDWLSPAIMRNGLQDDDPQVRFRLLSQAVVANVTLPADMVERLALTDQEAEVRLAALAAVNFHPDIDRQQAERIAMQASTDPDAAVQSKALELMAHIEAMQTGDTDDGLIRPAVAPAQ